MILDSDTIDDLTALWVRLTDALDFHARKWYAPNENGDWEEISFANVHDLLYDLGVGEEIQFEEGKLIPDPAREKVIQQFFYRDQEAHARPTDDIKRAQLRFQF